MNARPALVIISLVLLTPILGLAQDTGSASVVNKALQSELSKMGEEDQKGRAAIQELQAKKSAEGTPATSPEELKALWSKQTEIDRVNMKRLEEIIKEHGWPGKSLVGEDGARTAFLILQHADLDTQRKYFPLLKEAVAKGEAQPMDSAMLEDRILMYEGKKQIYGTQLHTVDGKYELYPIEDEEHVDVRRAAVGLPPLAVYLKYFGLEYQPPKGK